MFFFFTVNNYANEKKMSHALHLTKQISPENSPPLHLLLISWN